MTENLDPSIVALKNDFMDGLNKGETTTQETQTTTETTQAQETTTQQVEQTQETTEATTTQETQTAETTTETITEPTPIADDIKLKAFNEYFGTSFTSLDEVSGLKSALEEVPTLREIKSKYQELEATPLAKFANDKLRELNTFAETTGIDSPSVFEKIKKFEASETKDPIEALVIAEILKNPDLASETDMLRKKYQREYRTNLPDPEDVSDEEYQKAKEDADLVNFNLRLEASKAQKTISETLDKVKIGVPNETIKQIQERKEAISGAWNSFLTDKTEQLFAKIPVRVPLGKDGKGNDLFDQIDFIPTKEEMSEAVKSIVTEAASRGMELNEENLRKLVPEQWNRMTSKNIEKVGSKIYKQAEAKIRLEMEKKYANPSNLKIETPATPITTKVKTADELLDAKYRELGYL